MSDIKIKILAGLENSMVIGAIQSLTLPCTSDEHPKFSAFRIRVNKLQIAEIFSGSQALLQAQKYPFSIVIEEDGKETVRFHNVWILSISTTYISNDWVIMEAVDLEAEKISGTITYNSEVK